MAIGPQQNSRVTSSQVLIEFLMQGGAPFVLPLSPQITDVRDVARAHVRCRLQFRTATVVDVCSQLCIHIVGVWCTLATAPRVGFGTLRRIYSLR